ncbi:MAG: hypothetical protein R3C30_12650 [Hyphomonadaceae bacterium]
MPHERTIPEYAGLLGVMRGSSSMIASAACGHPWSAAMTKFTHSPHGRALRPVTRRDRGVGLGDGRVGLERIGSKAGRINEIEVP